MGNIIGIVGTAIGQAWEELQMANNQYDPQSARGANLSALVFPEMKFRRTAE